MTDNSTNHFAPLTTPTRLGSRLRDSFFGLVRPKSTKAPQVPIERIRLAMLLVMDEAGGRAHPSLERSLLLARDVDTLWYARPALMSALAISQGEANARARLAEITVLFQRPETGARRLEPCDSTARAPTS